MKYILFLLILPFLILNDAYAQRSSDYQELIERSDQPNIYSNYLALPRVDQNSLFMINFRMDYDLLPFRRIQANQEDPEEAEYYSTARVSMEIFREDTPVTRGSWADTTWANTYEQTRSRTNHLEGALSTNLDAGEYRLLLDLNREGTPSLRQPSSRNRRSDQHTTQGEQSIEIPDFETHDQGTMAILESAEKMDQHYDLRLMNFGESALYGQDYQLLALLPETSDRDHYVVRVETLQSGSNGDTEGDPVFEQTVGLDKFIYTDGFSHTTGSKQPDLTFNIQDEGYRLLILEIPNSRFSNSRFKVTVTADGEEEPVAATVVNSRWIDMPVSLLNLDIAIEMLRFIVDDDVLRQMRRGSNAEKERRFREFWSERDPTTDTEFNELMAEYYSRIDHAYNTYTTPEQPGFESDQGQAYILYGAPDRKERQYPTNAPTREIWEYSNRTLVFEATTGFGDFRLVQQQ